LVALYLTSSAGGTGKTSVAAGLARRLTAQGKKVGFLKPVVAGQSARAGNDAAVMQRFLGLPEPVDVLAPAFADEGALRAGIKAAMGLVSPGRDVVIVEGPAARGQLALEVASVLGATVLGVETYVEDPASLVAYYRGMGNRLAGVIMNKVPGKRKTQVEATFAARPGGIKLVGTILEERTAAGMSVAELAEDINGSVVSGAGRPAVIENIMLAAMNPDHGHEYYGWRAKKAVIVRSDRPDMQLAALETPTVCLVVSGGKAPISMVLMRAEANSVPVITTRDGVPAVVAGIEAGLRAARLNDVRAAAVADLVNKSLDGSALFRDMGVSV
jgi:BioD-like phosphotransacetylase family protein